MHEEDEELRAAEVEMHAREVQASRELCFRSYADFVKEAWPIVEPATPLKWNWHHDRFCGLVEDMFYLRVTDAIVNVPPACTKSSIFGVFHAPWVWSINPAIVFGFFSYDESLLLRDGSKSIDLMRSEWYRERWGDLLKSNDPARGNFETRFGGRRFSSSVGGKAIGWHFDYRIVDDSIKPQSVLAGTDPGTIIESVETWWFGTMSTRIRNPDAHRTLIVGQRVIEDDLPGKLLKDPRYKRYVYPMRYDGRHPYKSDDDPRSSDGELLWADRFPERVVAKLEIILGVNAPAQLQQLPGSGGSSFVSVDQLRELPLKLFPDRDLGIIVLSFDFAFKSKASSSYVAGGVFQYYRDTFYVRHAVIKKLSFVQSLQLLFDMHQAWPEAQDILVEEAANGIGIIDIVKEKVPKVVPISCHGLSKPARFHAVTPHFAIRKVVSPLVEDDEAMLPEYEWVEEWKSQITKFPVVVRNDAVDMTSQALTHLAPSAFQVAFEQLLSGNLRPAYDSDEFPGRST